MSNMTRYIVSNNMSAVNRKKGNQKSIENTKTVFSMDFGGA